MSADMISFPEMLEQKLQTMLHPVALFCFSSRHAFLSAQDSLSGTTTLKTTTHYKVLVIVASYKPNAIADTTNIIKDCCPEITISLLLHRATELRLPEGDQQFFFHNVMKKAGYTWKMPGAPPFLPFEKPPRRDLAATAAFWEKSQTIARHYLEAAISVKEKGSGHIGISWLHQVVEHIALGAIRVFLGYSPNHFSLGYLLGLCGDVLHSTHYFPLDTETDRHLFQFLSAHPSTLRHRVALSAREEDYTLLLNRCEKFLDNAGKRCNEELSRLETIFPITIKTN